MSSLPGTTPHPPRAAASSPWRAIAGYRTEIAIAVAIVLLDVKFQ